MSTSIAPIGDTIAPESHESSRNDRSVPYIAPQIVSVHDLLAALRENPPAHYGMLRSTASKLSEYFKLPCDQITLDSVADNHEDFRLYLAAHKYAKNSIRAYSNYVHVLLGEARHMKWAASAPTLPETWLPLVGAIENARCERILKYVVKEGRSPSSVSENDLYNWVAMMVKRGRSYDHVQNRANSFRRILVKAGFILNLSNERVRKPDYGVTLELFPAPLRKEVRDLLKWKQDKFAPARPSKARIRPVSAANLQQAFCQLFGFATTIEGRNDISSLSELFTEELVTQFVAWSLEERAVKGKTLDSKIGALYAALRYHPKYKHLDFVWCEGLLKSIPPDSEEELLRRKEQKVLSYQTVAAIPQMIRTERQRLTQYGMHTVAQQVRNELLMKWLVILPWRQRNLRECRIAGSSPNLFKAKLPVLSNIAKPKWLQEMEKQNPNPEVWQFRFSSEETKTGYPVHCVLPHQLVELLEEYLNDFRVALVRGDDPGTLFLNTDGGSMTLDQVGNLVSELTLRYGGRIVTPHIFRDIFVYMWLEKCPEDFLTVSKALWHRNINTTLQKYGSRYNESTALCRIEELL